MKPPEVVAFESAFQEWVPGQKGLDEAEANLFLLSELEKVRGQILDFYAAHPEHLGTADENVRRHFGLDMSKYGNWEGDEIGFGLAAPSNPNWFH